MSPDPTAPPSQTIIGIRAQNEKLALEELFLVLVNTERAGQTFPIPGGGLRIGKSSDNDLVLDHPTVSRAHLVLHRQGHRVLVRDLDSTNGTFIDGAQIKEGYLAPGSMLEVGDVQLRFQDKVVELDPSSADRVGELVGKSLPMRQIFALIERIGPSDATLLLVGETGSGKGAAAKTLHSISPRKNGPLVVFDCASVSDTLIESELFGHERGAFTGAVNQRVGCLERADGGTLFIDEIDDLALDLQPKLLRALEDREFRRVGASSGAIKFDTRVIAASKKDLWAETQAGRFREDLYFRLSVFTLSLPPLRDRREDLPLLVDTIAGEKLWDRLNANVREQFQNHSWPGNVRELRNAVERARHMADIPELSPENLLREIAPPTAAAAPVTIGDAIPVDYAGGFKESKDALVRTFEREYLVRLLHSTRGNIARAARQAGLDRKHLYSLLHKYGLAKTETPADE